MKCYTIDEAAKRGLMITCRDGEDPVLRVGEEQQTVIGVSRDFKALFKKRAKRIQQFRTLLERLSNPDLLEGADRELREILRKEQTDALLQQLNDLRDSIPAYASMLTHLLYATIWANEEPRGMSIDYAEIGKDGQLIKERGSSSDCLVHIITKAPLDEEGRLYLESSSWDEEVVSHRWGDEVERTFRPFPPPGVEIIATGSGPSGEMELVVRMKKRASFRICRKGDPSTFGDDPKDPPRYPVLVVAWPGSTLRCFPPKRFEKTREKTAA